MIPENFNWKSNMQDLLDPRVTNLKVFGKDVNLVHYKRSSLFQVSDLSLNP